MADKRKSYQAFLRAAKKKYDLPHAKAQKLYRSLSERLDKPARANDIKVHPRISKQEAERAARSRPRKKKIIGRPAAPAAPISPPKKRISSLSEWVGLQGMPSLDFVRADLAAGVDYSGGKGRGLVSFQLDIVARIPSGYTLSHRVVDQAVREWAVAGKAPKGFGIAIKDWKDKNSREKLRPVLIAGTISFKATT